MVKHDKEGTPLPDDAEQDEEDGRREKEESLWRRFSEAQRKKDSAKQRPER
jgi:hypothetical protein